MSKIGDWYAKKLSEYTGALERLNSESLEEYKSNVSQLYDDVASDLQEKKEELEEYHEEMLGVEEEDGSFSGGRKQEVESLYERLKNSFESYEKKMTEYSKRIETSLAGATAVTLASAFGKQKRAYLWPNVFWVFVFVCSILTIIHFSLDAYKDTVLILTKQEDKNYLKAVFSIILARLPFLAAMVWLAYFAGKQQSQNKRLEQEYAFREALATSYVGFRKEIANLEEDEEGQEVSLELQRKLVEAFGKNPSETLDNPVHYDEPWFIKLAMVWKGWRPPVSISKTGKKDSLVSSSEDAEE